MPRSQILNYRIHGRLHCDLSVRNGLRQDVIQNSFWHHEIECTWGCGGGETQKGIRLRSMQHHNILLMLDSQQWEMETHWCVFAVHIIPCAGLGLTRDVKAQSLRGHYCIDWSLKHGCLILNSRSSERLCQQILEVGPLVFGRYAFVFGCFSRAPIVLLGAFHTFHPTLLLIGYTVFYTCNQIS